MGCMEVLISTYLDLFWKHLFPVPCKRALVSDPEVHTLEDKVITQAKNSEQT